MEQIINKVLEFLSGAAQGIVQLVGGAETLFAIYVFGIAACFILLFMKYTFAKRKKSADAIRVALVPFIWPLIILYLILRIFR